MTRRLGLVVPLVALALLAACSSAEKAAEPAAPGADQPFPKLATVPDKPPSDNPQQRMQIREGLFADRRNARYLADGGPRAGYGKAPDRVTAADMRAEIIRPGSARERPVRTVDGVRIVRSGFVAEIEFAAKATALPPGSGRKIVRIAELQGIFESTLTVIGQAGTGETATTAQARAQAVASGLTTMGVPPGKIRIRRGDGTAPRVEVYMSGGRAPQQPQQQQ